MVEPLSIGVVYDLNRLTIDDETVAGLPLDVLRSNLSPVAAVVEVMFTDLRARLVTEIRRYPAVIGCTAWLTDQHVLAALAECQFVSMIVQKEDFLRPDVGQSTENARSQALDYYERLPSGTREYELAGGSPTGLLSYCGDITLEPIRCIGVRPNDTQQRDHPRMHHKFLVFCDWQPAHPVGEEWDMAPAMLVPQADWTGSFNPMTNGSRSLENAVLIRDHRVAQAFAREHAILLAVSEPLNWTERYVAPEWRIGS